MNAKDVLELQNLFTIAAQRAKIRNKVRYVLNIDAKTLASYIEEAFPKYKNTSKAINLAKVILQSN